MIAALQRYWALCKRSPIEGAFIGALLLGMTIYGGSKPPRPPEVTEQGGITITEQTVDSEGITIKWTVDDERIAVGEAVFIIEARERPIKLGKTIVFQPTNTEWYEIGRTKDLELATPGVWTDKTREIRVRTVIQEGTDE